MLDDESSWIPVKRISSDSHCRKEILFYSFIRKPAVESTSNAMNAYHVILLQYTIRRHSHHMVHRNGWARINRTILFRLNLIHFSSQRRYLSPSRSAIQFSTKPDERRTKSTADCLQRCPYPASECKWQKLKLKLNLWMMTAGPGSIFFEMPRNCAPLIVNAYSWWQKVMS